MFKKALVPLDGSTAAESVLTYASHLAQALDIPLVALATAGSYAPPQGSTSSAPNAQAYLQEAVKRCVGARAKVESLVGAGRPAEDIIRVAEQQGCGLIAMAARGEGQADRGLLSDVTMKLLYSSPLPLLVVNPDKVAQHVKAGLSACHLVAPMDGSPFGETVLPYVEHLAQRLSTQVSLVRTVESVHPTAYMVEPTMATAMVQVGIDLDQEAADYLQRIAEELKREKVSTQTKVLKGAPAQSIVQWTSKLPLHMIVMSTHGHSALARWFIGSVTEATVRTSEDMVLIIPRKHGRRHAIEVTELLERAPLFSGLTRSDLESVAQTASIRPYRTGEIVVRESDRAGGFFIVASGRVEVIKALDTPRAKNLGTLGPGEFFGEMAMLDDHPRSATVRALEDTECVLIRRSDFAAELQRRPQIAVAMLAELVKRLREARESLTE
ncbi:MAG TPA: universal stress protein [Candidatus Bipolaricaulota bacterium]